MFRLKNMKRGFAGNKSGVFRAIKCHLECLIKRFFATLPRAQNDEGFLLLEVIIGSLIITASIAAAMYLFRVDFQLLEKANKYNIIDSKIPNAINFIQNADLYKNSNGTEQLGEGVVLVYQASLIDKTIPLINTGFGSAPTNFEIYLYNVHFKITYEDYSNEYDLHVFKYNKTSQAQEFAP
jgi:hypothetical protein